MHEGTEEIVTGRFLPGQVTVEYDPAAFNPGEEFAGIIEDEWGRRLREAEERGGVLFDGPLARLDGWDLRGNYLHISLRRTSYKVFVGTNLRDPGLPANKRADPVGNSVLIVTSDNKIILGRRSETVYGHPGWIHCLGGHIEPERDAVGMKIDTFASMAAEIVEELDIEREDISEIICLGLIINKESKQPEQIFYVGTGKSSEELKPRGSEHSGLVAVGNDAASIDEFLRKEKGDVVPVAAGALRAYKKIIIGA